MVADLVTDKLVSKEAADQLLINRRSIQSSQHPLIIIANQKWKDPRDPRRLLHLETLTQWLAEKCGLDYFHIDPFKVDFAAVTKIMSNAYAERYKVLPVAVTAHEVTIATAEPYVREWETQLKHILRRDIKRVITNPVEIQSYIVEFYNLARSVKTASAQDRGNFSDVTNFEQLVQLGRSGKLDANDSHTSCIFATGCLPMRFSNAPVIFTSNRAAMSVTCAFASTAHCIRCIRFPRR